MWVFIVFYGLDWVATVPPTVALCRTHFGLADSGVVFGWVFASHMVGAGVGGQRRRRGCAPASGDYHGAWLLPARCACRGRGLPDDPQEPGHGLDEHPPVARGRAAAPRPVRPLGRLLAELTPWPGSHRSVRVSTVRPTPGNPAAVLRERDRRLQLLRQRRSGRREVQVQVGLAGYFTVSQRKSSASWMSSPTCETQDVGVEGERGVLILHPHADDDSHW